MHPKSVLYTKEGELLCNKYLCGLTFDQVFEQYHTTVYRLAYARTGNRFDAEDVLQTVFLKLMKTDTCFAEPEHIKAWLIKVAANTSKNLLTSAWMRLTEGIKDDYAVDEHKNLEVYSEVLKLPVKYRTVVHLFYYEGYSCAEIATILETKEATVKTRLKRARERLKEALKGEDFGV